MSTTEASGASTAAPVANSGQGAQRETAERPRTNRSQVANTCQSVLTLTPTLPSHGI